MSPGAAVGPGSARTGSGRTGSGRSGSGRSGSGRSARCRVRRPGLVRGRATRRTPRTTAAQPNRSRRCPRLAGRADDSGCADGPGAPGSTPPWAGLSRGVRSARPTARRARPTARRAMRRARGARPDTPSPRPGAPAGRDRQARQPLPAVGAAAQRRTAQRNGTVAEVRLRGAAGEAQVRGTRRATGGRHSGKPTARCPSQRRSRHHSARHRALAGGCRAGPAGAAAGQEAA